MFRVPLLNESSELESWVNKVVRHFEHERNQRRAVYIEVLCNDQVVSMPTWTILRNLEIRAALYRLQHLRFHAETHLRIRIGDPNKPKNLADKQGIACHFIIPLIKIKGVKHVDGREAAA